MVSAQAEHTRPLPNPPLDGSLGQSHHPQGKGFTEQGVVETVTTFCPELQDTALCWPAEGGCEEWRRGRGSTRERRDQVPFRKHRKDPRGRVETATEQEQK